MENYTIVLYDGTIIDNLTLNGNNFISPVDVGEDKLTVSNLSRITINGEVYTDMLLRNYWQDTDGWHIIISEATQQEKFAEEITAKIDYLAMMGGIDL